MCPIVRTAGLRIRIGAFALGLCFLAPQHVLAFAYPIQAEYVREAYFLGRTTDGKKFKGFYEQYVRYFPFPARGPYFSYVESVEFRTPYEQVVLRSRQNLSQYSSMEAEKDYQAQPNLVVIRVLISYKSGYVGPLPPASSFKVHVSQADAHTIEPKKLTTETICSVSWNSDCGAPRFAILLSFDAEQFSPGTAKIKIVTPDGQTIKTEFDLDNLI
jgi:hypothetical protein